MTHRVGILVSLFAIIAGSLAQAGLPQCKGIGLRDLPGGFIDLGGSLIGVDGDNTYGFEHVCKGRLHQLWLQRSTTAAASDEPAWSTVATLAVPQVGEHELFVYGHWCTCQRSSVPDPAIVAIVKDTRNERFTTVIRAWRANSVAGRFEPISTAGITCNNDNHGL
jgi:hypothetical protein